MTIQKLPNTRPQGKVVVLISWDGKSQPLFCAHIDCLPNFDLILFDYSGKSKSKEVKVIQQGAYTINAEVVSECTECKGDIFQALGKHFINEKELPEYIGVLDDDIVIAVSDINRAIHCAKVKNLDVFSPTLTHDSEFSHRWMLQQPHILVREVDWVEVMMPFYRGDLLMVAAPFFTGFSTSWGFDKFLFPMLQKLTGATRCGLIDAVAGSHFRPVTSQTKTYKNGLTASQEMAEMKKICIDFLHKNHADLTKTKWFDRLFIQKNVYTRTQKNIYRIGRPIKQWLARST